jgi:DNA-binding transcriptional regulator YiaG
LIANLKRWGKERGMNIDQLVHHLGVSRTTLHYWETGERYPNKQNRRTIYNKTDILIPPPRRRR